MKKLVRISEWIVAVMGMLISSILLIEKIFNSYDEMLQQYHFNLVHFCGAVFTFVVCFYLVNTLCYKLPSAKAHIIINIAITLIFELIFCLSIIMGSGIYFRSDVGAVYNLAVRFLHDDYSSIMLRDSYLGLFPQQYGIIFIYEMMMRILGKTNGMIIQLMNIALVISGTLAGYGIVWKTFPKRSSITAYSLLWISFFPFFFHAPAAYGDLPATCLVIIGVYFVLQMFQKSRHEIIWMTLAAAAIVLACIFKKNALVCLLAIALVSIVMLLRKFDWKRALWLLLIFFLAIMSTPFIQKTYELRSGQESGRGIPMITFVAMSMQEGLGAPGAWSGYHVDLFMQNDYDYDATVRQAREDIQKALSGFIHNPGYMFGFYTTKVAYQWTNGGFDGIGSGIANAFGDNVSPWVQNILNGPAHGFFNFVSNWHQCVVYLFFMMSMLSVFKDIKKGKTLCPGEMLLTVIIIGGFLFELIWESASRYVMMYYAMMLPPAAAYMAEIYEALRKRKNS